MNRLLVQTAHLRSNDDDLGQLHFRLTAADCGEDVLQLADHRYEGFHLFVFLLSSSLLESALVLFRKSRKLSDGVFEEPVMSAKRC
jgi:hypothetical protein